MTNIYIEEWINPNASGYNIVIKRDTITGHETQIISLTEKELKQFKKVVASSHLKKGYDYRK